MATTTSYVTIKGTKDGLVFNLDDSCSFQDVYNELRDKLENSYHHFLEGPIIRVTVQLGFRYLKKEQELEIRDLIRSKGNLFLTKIESQVTSKEELLLAGLQSDIQVLDRTVRSGQVYQCDRNMLVLGDVNPGGSVQAVGSIYIMGALRGMAHAGIQGDQEAIVAASLLQPTQLRIATVISRPPDEWEEEVYDREFAYIEKETILVDKIQHLAKIRPSFKRS